VRGTDLLAAGPPGSGALMITQQRRQRPHVRRLGPRRETKLRQQMPGQRQRLRPCALAQDDITVPVPGPGLAGPAAHPVSRMAAAVDTTAATSHDRMPASRKSASTPQTRRRGPRLHGAREDSRAQPQPYGKEKVYGRRVVSWVIWSVWAWPGERVNLFANSLLTNLRQGQPVTENDQNRYYC
jgi:hypothetical protein